MPSLLAIATLAVLWLADARSQVYQINRTEEKGDKTDKTEYRVANLSESYEDTVKAFRGADALIHLSSVVCLRARGEHSLLHVTVLMSC